MIRRNILILSVLFVLILSACSPAAQTATNIPENPEQSPAATAPQLTEEQSQITAAATETLESPTPEVELSPTPEQPQRVTMQELITNTLALVSVKMSLETIYADGKAVQQAVEVDQQGNYSLAKTYTGLPQGYPEELGVPPAKTLLVVVDGTAYGPDNDGKLAKAEAGLVTLLENLLRGASGPGMWLSVLPQGSLTIAGQESKGGFETTKYSLQGDIEGNVITGEIWVELQTKALVAAELVVPGALLGSPEQPAPGNLEIHFLVEAAQVAPVTVGEAGE
jgi:hypothetical protein